jgi:cytochrome c oxidase cbb3-type subunit III
MTRHFAWLPLTVLLLLASCKQRGASAPVAAELAPAGEAATLELGRKVYNFRCYFCHGYSGNAKTLAATYLTPPPRDFTRGATLTRQAIHDAVEQGREGTAMKPFRGILGEAELTAVAAFVEREFVRDRAHNTAYHTAENGWPEHERFKAAFAFVTGAVKLDTAVESLDAEQRRGRRLYLSACVSCHDRAHVADEGPAWSARPLSYPRMGFAPGQASLPTIDAVSGASVYAKHEVAPRVARLSARERRGERLFQANCAFCHGADGTGKNWIGQFMEPKARDLTTYTPQSMPPLLLRRIVRDGLPGTSMPAWRSVLPPADIDAVSAYVTRAFLRRDGGA